MNAQAKHCPCGSELPFDDCCGLLISDHKQATTAEQLMRSRYAAYVQRNEEYIKRTWHVSTRPSDLRLDATPHWQGLTIVKTMAGLEGDMEGTVDFVARYTVDGITGDLHETSRFLKEEGRWFYLDGSTK